MANRMLLADSYRHGLPFDLYTPVSNFILKDTEALHYTVLLPVMRPPYLLPNAIESVLGQTQSDFELFIICDGAPPETIDCVQEFARRDARVKLFSFSKGQRHGEAHLHTVLTKASGNFVAYLEDDDLWFPNHLDELEKLLLTVDFGHTIHVTGHPDGHLESLPSDLGNQAFRQRFLDDLFNTFGLTVCGHRLDAYRRLPEGWAPTPVGMYNDLHMWRKFFRMSEFKFGTRMVITAVTLPSHIREHMSLEERAREAGVWVSRIVDERERANIIEDAWHSVVGKGIHCEQEILKINSSHREAKAALAQMEAMHPDSLQKVGHEIEVQANSQLELERLNDRFNLSQFSLSIMTARADVQAAAIAAHQADLAKLNATLAESKTEYERIVRLRELYLDLLSKSLTNMIYGDPSTNPENSGPFQPGLRSEGRDWPATAHTMIGVRRLENVQKLAQRVIDEGIPGDFIETGVWRGGCCIFMRGVLAANAINDRKVYAVDSYEGLPAPKPHLFPHDAGLNLHLYTELAVSLEQVKENFSRYGLLDEQVVFVRGLFQDTLPALNAGPFALMRLDGDLYESTFVALEALYPKLSAGGFVIIDDYGVLPSCQTAVSDYRRSRGIEAPMHEIDWSGIWWQKPCATSP